jgi:hypothetical protein
MLIRGLCSASYPQSKLLKLQAPNTKKQINPNDQNPKFKTVDPLTAFQIDYLTTQSALRYNWEQQK